MLYKFKLGHNAMEETKNICCAKGDEAVEHSIAIRWSKKFWSGCKNHNDQAKSSRAKTGFWGCAPSYRGKHGEYQARSEFYSLV